MRLKVDHQCVTWCFIIIIFYSFLLRHSTNKLFSTIINSPSSFRSQLVMDFLAKRGLLFYAMDSSIAFWFFFFSVVLLCTYFLYFFYIDHTIESTSELPYRVNDFSVVPTITSISRPSIPRATSSSVYNGLSLTTSLALMNEALLPSNDSQFKVALSGIPPLPPPHSTMSVSGVFHLLCLLLAFKIALSFQVSLVVTILNRIYPIAPPFATWHMVLSFPTHVKILLFFLY